MSAVNGAINRILVTGGTGKTGKVLSALLLEDGRQVRIASRKAPEGLSAAQHVVFDWMKPETHRAAVDGVDAVYLVAPSGVVEPLDLMKAFFDTAIKNCVRRFILLSARVYPEGSMHAGRVHTLLRERAPEWAVLQPSWFMQNFSEGRTARSIRERNSFRIGARGKVAFVDVRDIAAVARAALLTEQSYNAALPLTGPEALTYSDAAAILSRVLGREIKCIMMEAEEHRGRLIAAGLADDFVEHALHLDELIDRGDEQTTVDTVLRVTGKRPMSFAEFVREHADRWSARALA